MYPEELEVHVTSRNLGVPRREDILLTVVREALDAAGLPYTGVRAGNDNVYVYSGGPGHVARYWIPDDLWKVRGRYAAGMRVKPGMFVLPAVYRRVE